MSMRFSIRGILAISGMVFLALMVKAEEGYNMAEVKSGVGGFPGESEQDIVVCSAMSGIITFKGEPAAGAKIVRWSAWKDHLGEFETFRSDEDGSFFLPEKIDSRPRNLLDHGLQFVARQTVTVLYGGAEHRIWKSSKTRTYRNAEYGGNPARLRCELTDTAEPLPLDGVLYLGSCKWTIVDKKGANTNGDQPQHSGGTR